MSKRDARSDPLAAEIEQASRSWRLVWQVDSERRSRLMWGDLGHLYLLMRDADLREARFDRAWMYFDCY